MKKMMTNIKTLAALLIASATFVACSSDDNIIDEQPASQQVYTLSVSATKGGDEALTRALSLDGKTLNATWATTENIYVKKGDTWATGSLKPQTDGTTATLKGTLSGITIEASDVLTLQFPRSGALDYTGQVGTLADIAAKYDYATATVTVASVSATGNINPTAATTTFTNQQAIVKFTLVDKADGTTPLNATQLTVNDGNTDYTVTPASATSEIYVAIPGIADKTVTLTATVGSDTYTYEKANVTFTNGKYYSITVKMTKQASAPEGALSGQFSVSDTKKVYFSKGNLKCNGSTWSFFGNQYDYYTSHSSDAWDKFGWSTSATTYGMNTSTEKSTYSGNFVDWGATMGSGWRTLSSAEWTYLFNTRSASTVGGTENGRYAKAKVNDVQGVILFPDTYTHPTGVTAPTGVNATDNTGWKGNNYSSADWTKMESAGCVFLPAAGHRYGSTVEYVGSHGYYWSSSPYTSGANNAYYVGFGAGYLDPVYGIERNRGHSVRLVRDVE